MSNNGSAHGLPLPGSRAPSTQATTPFSQEHTQASAHPHAFQTGFSTTPGTSATSPSAMPDPAASGTERRPSRTLGVHSILNPSHAEDAEQRGRRRSAAQMEESTPEGVMSVATDSLTRPPSSGGSGVGEKSPTGLHAHRGGMPRRILTPISPTLHRTASLGRIVTGNIPTGTIDAQQSPFLSPTGTRIHTIEPGTANVPHLPGPPGPQVMQRASLPMPHAHTPPLISQQRRGSVGLVHSARASPSPSYSSYGPSGQPSPAMPYAPSSGPTPPGSSGLAPSPIAGPLSAVPLGSLDLEQPSGIPVVSTGQNTYQLMAIPTGKGPVQIPVEMQAASRMADEKRKRNAGASARFRQRRKEKEREATTRITMLERQLSEALEEIEWYKKERQELLIALQALPGGERYLPREKSPRTRRAEVAAGSQNTSSQQRPYTFERAGPADTERNTRQKLEIFTLPPPSTGDPTQSSYPPVTYPAQYQPTSQSAQNFTSRPFSDPSLITREQPYEREGPPR